MEIIGRNPNTDPYSIEKISFGLEQITETHSQMYFYVSLKPRMYQGTDGRLLGPKDNACELKISLSEFQEMEQTLKDKLQDSYQFLAEQGLLQTFWKQKSEPQTPAKVA